MARFLFPGNNTQILAGSCAQAVSSPTYAAIAASQGPALSCIEDGAGGAAGDDQPPPLATQTSESIFDIVIGGAVGFITGGPAGAAVGAATAAFGGADDTPPPVIPTTGFAGGVQCPSGTIKVANRCVDAFPGGDTQGQGVFVPSVDGGGGGAGGTSALGTPRVPGSVGRTVRRCPPMHVLADLGSGTLCYHKKLIPNRLRLYPKAQAPALSARDKRMIRKYAKGGAKSEMVADLAKELGFHVTDRAPSRKKKK